ncbi:MAG: CaiB/BaiF CoA transferase family protein [Acidimicrobiales bacterium]
MEGLPLQSLRVLDMADERGQLAGRILAELGADVVLVEPPGGARSRGYHPLHGEVSLYFAVRNFNKRSVIIDIDTDAGREQLLCLLERADIWLETTAPGRLAALGLDPAGLTARFERLVAVSMTDFGQTGPYRDWAGTDDVVVALAGELFRSGTLERPPLLVPGSLAYDVTGIMGALAALSACWQRETGSGRGQHIDLSALEATAQVTDWSLPNFSAITANLGLYGEIRSGHGPVYPLYPCADGFVRLVILSPRQWHAMRAWLGEPEFLQDEHWDSLLGRMSIQADVLDPLLTDLFAGLKMADLAAEAQRRGIVMTPCLGPADVLETKHFLERGSFGTVEVAPELVGPMASGFYEIDGTRAGWRRRAPAPGEDQGLLDGLWMDGRAEAPARTAVVRGGGPALPFTKVRVIDFGHGGVGVEAARILAEYGADVIKIETRTYPDFIRLVSGSEISASFTSSNCSKRSFGVNVKTEEGLALVKDLVAGADVVIENNSTGTMERMGLGYDALRAVNPDLVMVSSQLMGSRGEWSAWLGYGPSTRPVGGMTWLWNYPDGGMPPGAQVVFPDHVAGRLCALGAVAGLLGRRQRNQTGHVEVAQVEVVLNLMAQYFLAEGLAPGTSRPLGNRRAQGAPWGVYRCAGEERWCVITCRDDSDWLGLRRAMGDPAWASDPALDGAEGRHLAHELIDAALSEWTGSRTDTEVMATLQAEGVPAGRMTYASDIPEEPQLKARGYPIPIHQPGLGDILLEGPCFRASGMAPPIIAPAPGLGEHTRVIAADLLGLGSDRIEELITTGVLEVDRPVS